MYVERDSRLFLCLACGFEDLPFVLFNRLAEPDLADHTGFDVSLLDAVLYFGEDPLSEEPGA